MYRSAIPEFRKTLQGLRKEFLRLEATTDWARLRVDPVLRHAIALERRLNSAKFSREIARLHRGVALFHADLVYLRTNVRGLQRLLVSEQRRTRSSR